MCWIFAAMLEEADPETQGKPNIVFDTGDLRLSINGQTPSARKQRAERAPTA